MALIFPISLKRTDELRIKVNAANLKKRTSGGREERMWCCGDDSDRILQINTQDKNFSDFTVDMMF